MNKIIGIDVGGSTTKIVGFDCSDVACSRMLSPMNVKASDQIASVYGAFGKFTSENNIGIDDIEKIKADIDALQKAIYEVSAKLYQQANPNGDPNMGGQPGCDGNCGDCGNHGANGDGYVDADYREVNDN